jgi:diguanylate cyclase (GGDEF)-like protein
VDTERPFTDAVRDVERLSRERTQTAEPDDPRIRRTWWFFAASLAVAGLAMALRLATGDAGPLDWLLTGLLVVAGVAAIVHRRAVAALELRRRIEAESTTRLLRGLSRSVSPDAIVGAIAGELASGVEADHVVVVRRREDPPRLEATLVSTRPGIPSSVTALPLSDLDDPVDRPSRSGRRPTPIAVAPMTPEPVMRMATPVMASAGAVGGPRTASFAVAPGLEEPQPIGPGRIEPVAAGQLPSSSGGGRERRSLDDHSAAAILVAERIAERVRSSYALRNTLSAPLVVDRAVAGALVLSRRTAAEWPQSTQRLLDEAATEASVALARATSYRAAEARASTDALTGLPNRRYFDEFCGLLARRRRAGDAVGVLMVDIDHFKRLNDRHGHAVGDEVLRAVAQAIGGAVREDDVPARYGGEEFAVLLRNPSRDVAVDIGQRVRAAVGALDLRSSGVATVSVSVGVAVQTAPDQPIAEIIEDADRALYRAKRAGRDRVVAA